MYEEVLDGKEQHIKNLWDTGHYCWGHAYHQKHCVFEKLNSYNLFTSFFSIFYIILTLYIVAMLMQMFAEWFRHCILLQTIKRCHFHNSLPPLLLSDSSQSWPSSCVWPQTGMCECDAFCLAYAESVDLWECVWEESWMQSSGEGNECSDSHTAVLCVAGTLCTCAVLHCTISVM